MGIFQRAHDIVQAKSNKALDAAEKPDEMLDLSYEKMLEQITQVRRALVDLAASKKRLELQEEQFPHTIDHLQDQAKQALQANREDLAKEALARKAAAQQQIDEMEPQRQQLEEEEKKLTTTLDALQKRVNDFRTQKETLKAQYTAAKAISTVDESAAGISKSFNDSGASLQRAQDKIATMQARSGALDELLESGVLEDVGGGTDDIQKELDQVGTGRPGRQRARRAEGAARNRRPPEPDALAPRRPSPSPRAPHPRVLNRSPRDELGHDVGQLRTTVLLEEVAGTGDGHVGSPGRTGDPLGQHLGPPRRPGVAVRERGEQRQTRGPQRLDAAPVHAGALAARRRPHQRRERRGPAAVGVVGKRRVVGGQDPLGHVRDGRPLHEHARTEGRQVLGEALVVEQHLSDGDRAVAVVVHGPGQSTGQRGVGGVQRGVGRHHATGQHGPSRQGTRDRWARPSPGRRGSHPRARGPR